MHAQVQKFLKCPSVVISIYCLVHIICWTSLINVKVDLSMDAFVIGSEARRNMIEIDRIFGQGDDLNIQQNTKLRHGLEVIVRPKPNIRLLSENPIRELIQLHARIGNSPVTGTNGILVLDNVCVKQFGRCVIEGDYLFDEDFLVDVINTDLRYQTSYIYSHARGGSGYGPYMLGKDILTAFGTITQVNALRFRYNLLSAGTHGENSRKWERGIIAQLLTWNHTFLDVSFGALSSFEDEFLKYFILDAAPFLGSLAGFGVISAIGGAILVPSHKILSFSLGLLNIGISVVSVGTIIGILSLIGYQISPIAIPCLIIQLAQSIIRWNFANAEIYYVHRHRSNSSGHSSGSEDSNDDPGAHKRQIPRPRSAGSCSNATVSADRSLSTITMSSIVLCFAFLTIGGLTDSNYVQCSCLMLGIAILLNAIHWQFVGRIILNCYLRRLSPTPNGELSRRRSSSCLKLFTKAQKRLNLTFVLAATLLTIAFVSYIVYGFITYKCQFKRSNLIPVRDSYYHTFLKNFEDEFIAGAPIMMVMQRPQTSNHTAVQHYFSRVLSACQKLPSTSSRFQVQWPSLINDVKDLTGLLTGESTGLALIKNDIKVERVSQDKPVIVNQSRAYCTFRTMDFSLNEILTMYGAYEIARKVSAQFKSLSIFPFSMVFSVLELILSAHIDFLTSLPIFLTALLFVLIAYYSIGLIYNQFTNRRKFLSPTTLLIQCFFALVSLSLAYLTCRQILTAQLDFMNVSLVVSAPIVLLTDLIILISNIMTTRKRPTTDRRFLLTIVIPLVVTFIVPVCICFLPSLLLSHGSFPFVLISRILLFHAGFCVYVLIFASGFLFFQKRPIHKSSG